jgi:DNA-binding IclR family transcriptional regulator
MTALPLIGTMIYIPECSANHEARPDRLRALPIQQELAERHGETAHYAVFDERSVVYRSKVDPDSDRL